VSLDPGLHVAEPLADFVRALPSLDTTGGPGPGGRGGPLAPRDERVRRSIAELGATVDADRLLAMWDEALSVPVWDRPGVWIHGDLHEANLLAGDDGRLSAVIDLGGLCVGDPAGDMLPAWLVGPDSRTAFREVVDVDEGTWARGRGWALSIALIALPYYRDTNPGIVARATFALAQVRADRS
jgi:aminoglycoside phosphotransferase (APT) family kinase protein